VLAREPANALARYNLGMALKQQDKFAEAEDELRRAIDADPALPDASFTLGVVLWQTGRPGEAAAAFRDAIRKKDAYPDAHYMLGTVLKQQGEADAAVAEFKRTIELLPTSAEAFLSLGQMLRQQGHDADAAAALEQARALNQRKADAQASTFAVSVGNEKLKHGDVAGAVAQYREAITLASDNPQAHYQLSVALLRRGARAEARREFDQARRLAPYLEPPAGLK
jgi:tetratricopeptide (TPR) repeat protein